MGIVAEMVTGSRGGGAVVVGEFREKNPPLALENLFYPNSFFVLNEEQLSLNFISHRITNKKVRKTLFGKRCLSEEMEGEFSIDGN